MAGTRGLGKKANPESAASASASSRLVPKIIMQDLLASPRVASPYSAPGSPVQGSPPLADKLADLRDEGNSPKPADPHTPVPQVARRLDGNSPAKTPPRTPEKRRNSEGSLIPDLSLGVPAEAPATRLVRSSTLTATGDELAAYFQGKRATTGKPIMDRGVGSDPTHNREHKGDVTDYSSASSSSTSLMSTLLDGSKTGMAPKKSLKKKPTWKAISYNKENTDPALIPLNFDPKRSGVNVAYVDKPYVQVGRIFYILDVETNPGEPFFWISPNKIMEKLQFNPDKQDYEFVRVTYKNVPDVVNAQFLSNSASNPMARVIAQGPDGKLELRGTFENHYAAAPRLSELEPALLLNNYSYYRDLLKLKPNITVEEVEKLKGSIPDIYESGDLIFAKNIIPGEEKKEELVYEMRQPKNSNPDAPEKLWIKIDSFNLKSGGFAVTTGDVDAGIYTPEQFEAINESEGKARKEVGLDDRFLTPHASLKNLILKNMEDIQEEKPEPRADEELPHEPVDEEVPHEPFDEEESKPRENEIQLKTKLHRQLKVFGFFNDEKEKASRALLENPNVTVKDYKKFADDILSTKLTTWR